MLSPKFLTLIIKGFTKSNFPPTNREGNYGLLKGSPSSSSSLVGSLASSRNFIFHPLNYFLHPQDGLQALGRVTPWELPCMYKWVNARLQNNKFQNEERQFMCNSHCQHAYVKILISYTKNLTKHNQINQ